MLRRFALAVLLLFAATFDAVALEYTDVYSIPEESGWGMFLIQSDTFQFIALFIYGQDGKPTWYTGELYDDGTGKTYTGTLYATTGTYFADAWDPNKLTGTAAGTASFTPADIYSGTLVYGLTGGPTVTKSLRRQTLLGYQMAGNYSGSAYGKVTDCTNPADNENPLNARYNLTVAQTADDSLSLTFNLVDAAHVGLVCTIAGPLTHFGRLYRMVDAQTTCTDGGGAFNYVVTVESLHPTGQGIEGRWSGQAGGGCQQAIRFVAVKR